MEADSHTTPVHAHSVQERAFPEYLHRHDLRAGSDAVQLWCVGVVPGDDASDVCPVGASVRRDRDDITCSGDGNNANVIPAWILSSHKGARTSLQRRR